MMTDNQEQIPFSQVLKELLDPDNIFKPKNIPYLSRLSQEEIGALEVEWENIPVLRRRSLVLDLATFAEADPLLFFDLIGKLAVKDSDADVRVAAIWLLALEEDPAFAGMLVDMLSTDKHYLVRAASAAALGRYVYLGSLDELELETFLEIENALLTAYRTDEQVLVRRRALESVSYSSNKAINPLIENAYSSGDEDWQESALIAMGLSVNPMWEANVLRMLEAESSQLRIEAALATGKLNIKEAKQDLIRMVHEESDLDVQQAAIWALSDLGGNDIGEMIEGLMEEAVSDEEMDFLDEAMENLHEAQMLNDMALPLFDFDEDSLNDLNEIKIDKEGDA